MAEPKIDILMATYNGERYIHEQVESIQNQTLGCWRLLVSDDCSVDGTVGIVLNLANDDDRIMLAGEGVRRGGAKKNFAHLMGLSTAPYAAFCDQDDVWLPYKLERLMSEMGRLEAEYGAEGPLIVFSDAKVVGEGLGLIAESFADFTRLDPERRSLAHLLAQNVAPGCLMLCNRPLLALAAPSVARQGVAMHDWWLMLVAAAFGHIGYVLEPLALYRQHGDNALGAQAFDVAERLGDLGRMDARFAETLRQAVEFEAAFGGALLDQLRAVVAEYAAMAEGGPVENVVHLSRSGAWKAGSRKAGQVLSAIRRGGTRYDRDL